MNKLWSRLPLAELKSLGLIVSEFVRQSKWIVVGVTVSLLSSVICVELSHLRVPASGYLGLVSIALTLLYYLYLIVWLSSYVAFFAATIVAIIIAFYGRSRGAIISRIMAAYFSLVVMFAAFYYSISAIADQRDAIWKYNYYKRESQLLEAGLKPKIRMIMDRRAFAGIRPRLWSGVDWCVEDCYRLGVSASDNFDPDISDIMEIAAKSGSLSEVVRFVPARAEVFIDCLHLSVATISTLGYGDIVPRSLDAKLAVDIEVLSGILLLVVAFGMAMGNWWEVEGDHVAKAVQLRIFVFLALGASVAFVLVYKSGEFVGSYRVEDPMHYAEIWGGRGIRHIERYLEYSSRDMGSWNYGNAIHKSNIALGVIALREGDIQKADTYLLEAGSTPGSPQLDSFGPQMFLANELLKRGERGVVLKYLELCRAFWRNGQDRLDDWMSQIKNGETPVLHRRGDWQPIFMCPVR